MKKLFNHASWFLAGFAGASILMLTTVVLAYGAGREVQTQLDITVWSIFAFSVAVLGDLSCE
jgi:hypothetical protein